MLHVTGRPFSCCDGVNRRSFLKAGFLGLGALTLPEFLRLRAQAGEAPPRGNAAVIFVELAGGPTHFETYDPKPDAPVEYRGPLGIVSTNVPGIYLSELMAEQARVMDKLAVIRSMHHASGSHGTSAHLTQTGYYLRDPQNRDNEMPCAGSIVAKLRGANAPGVPPFVSIPRIMRFGGAAYLSKAFNPFETGGDPNDANFQVQNLSLISGLDMNRLDDRRRLLQSFDESRQLADTQGVSEAMNEFSRQAFELVTGDRARRAFDLSGESAATRDKYGRNTTGQSLLLARRLVEAGVAFVTVRVGGWDDHTDIAKAMRQKGPAYDRGMAALVADLHGRGLDRDVLVVAMGEFGRTPRVNRNAGRDHWGNVMSVLIAGGGLRVGQAIGASNSKGEVPVDSPYRPENVLAVIYRHLGIDTSATFNDLAGRPRHILENRDLVDELV